MFHVYFDIDQRFRFRRWVIELRDDSGVLLSRRRIMGGLFFLKRLEAKMKFMANQTESVRALSQELSYV